MKPNWKIQQLKRLTNTGLVIEVTYNVTLNKDGVIASTLGKITLTGDVNDPNFIPYENLTEQIVLGWVIDSVDVEDIEAEVLTQYQTKLPYKPRTDVLSGLPWM